MTSRARRKHKAKNKLRRKLKEMLHAFDQRPPPAVASLLAPWPNSIPITPADKRNFSTQIDTYNAQVERFKIETQVAYEKAKIHAQMYNMVQDTRINNVLQPKRRGYPLMVRPKLLSRLIRRLK